MINEIKHRYDIQINYNFIIFLREFKLIKNISEYKYHISLYK
jgi:hypothetical protein